MFKELNKAVQVQFEKMSENQTQLFKVEIDKVKIREVFLNNFPEEVRQYYNCTCCKSFLGRYGNIISYIDGKIVSLWDLDLETISGEYHASVIALKEYVHGLPVEGLFLGNYSLAQKEEKTIGNDILCGGYSNFSVTHFCEFEHFHFILPKKFVNHASKSNAAILGAKNTLKQVFEKGLNELKLEALETVIELINENAISAGEQFRFIVEGFYKLKQEYDKSEDKENFCWQKVSNSAESILAIKSSVIGSLLEDLSSNESATNNLDIAIRKFDAKMGFYKRPLTTVLATSTVKKGKEALENMGYSNSLTAVPALESDIPVTKVLFKDNERPIIRTIWDEIPTVGSINPSANVPEMPIKDFIEKVVPGLSGMEVLFTREHKTNLVTLLKQEDTASKNLCNWDNPFRWAFTGDVATGIKERVKAAGGNIEAVLRCSLEWNTNGEKENTRNSIDFDLYAREPDNTKIHFGLNRKGLSPGMTTMSGQLDVDNRFPGKEVAIENITWIDKKKMKDGTYEFWVNNYEGRVSNGGFNLQIEFDGQQYNFAYNKNLKPKEDVKVAKVTLSNGIFTLNSMMENKSPVKEKKWNLTTGDFHKVKMMSYSPNFWGTNTGNKLTMFFLENCISDEEMRPFFNEFLPAELREHRKVLELVGKKMKSINDTHQLSGIGFDSSPNNLIVKVTGTYTRMLKLIF